MYYMPEIQHVDLWNNQFNRSNGTGRDGRKQVAFNYPCVFIKFEGSEFRQLSLGIQEFDMYVTLILGVKSFEDSDTNFLTIKERLYYTAQRFQSGNFARLSRVSEKWSYDNDNVNSMEIKFKTYGKDDFRYVFGSTTAQVLSNVITGETITTDVVTVLSGGTSGGSVENGNNIWIQPTDDNCNN